MSGSITLAANATDNVAVAGVQFQVDGANVGALVTGTGPSYSQSWNTAAVGNGGHTITAITSDTSGNTASASISVTVSNVVAPPVIAAVSASGITGASATITWTTDKPSDSQVAYGLTSGYGSMSSLNSSLVTSHSVTVSGLTPSTTYHYQVMSRDAQGDLARSGDYTFTTSSVAPPLLLLHADATEVSGVSNGSVVTPSIAPPGFSGTVVARNGGSVNFAPAQSGNGVYFLNCCDTSNAYYKFTGATVGSIFNVSQGQISFYLKSRYRFAQRQSSAAAARVAFDVRDDNVNNHVFYFLTQASSGYLSFAYSVGGGAQYYYAALGTEDTLFGAGVLLKVTITWDGSTSKLYLNDTQVQSSPYSQPTPNWTANSVFDLGATEYMNLGGYNSSDDVIDEFSVSGLGY